MLNQSVQNPLEGIGEVNAMGSGRASRIEYVPYSTKNKLNQTQNTKKKTKFPIYRDTVPQTRSQLNSYRGSKRAFLRMHETQARFAQQYSDKTWEQQEKIRAWNYKQQTRALETNIRCGETSALGDIRHKRLKIYGIINQTTGPRPIIKLPPDRQVTEYNPTHIHYF